VAPKDLGPDQAESFAEVTASLLRTAPRTPAGGRAAGKVARRYYDALARTDGALREDLWRDFIVELNTFLRVHGIGSQLDVNFLRSIVAENADLADGSAQIRLGCRRGWDVGRRGAARGRRSTRGRGADRLTDAHQASLFGHAVEAPEVVAGLNVVEAEEELKNDYDQRYCSEDVPSPPKRHSSAPLIAR
jgi:hypothetical protein